MVNSPKNTHRYLHDMMHLKLSVGYILENFTIKTATEILFLSLLVCFLQLIVFDYFSTTEIQWFELSFICVYFFSLFLSYFCPSFYLLNQSKIPFEVQVWTATFLCLVLVSVTFLKLATLFHTYYKK